MDTLNRVFVERHSSFADHFDKIRDRYKLLGRKSWTEQNGVESHELQEQDAWPDG